MRTWTRLRLAPLLIALNVGLIVVAVAGVALLAGRMMRQSAHGEALARVRGGALAAQEAIRESARDLASDAQLLAERPTLRRLASDRDQRGLTSFLRQFAATSEIDGLAVVVRGEILASAGEPLPWTELAPLAGAKNEAFLGVVAPDAPLVLGSSVPVAGLDGVTVAAADRLDAAFVESLATRVSLAVGVLSTDRALRSDAAPRAPIRARALSSESLVAARVERVRAYVAASPLRSPLGPVVGLIEVSLPVSDVDGPLHALWRRLALWALAAGALGAAASFTFGRQLARPLRRLTGAAEQIGLGDLSTPVPRSAGAELGSLSEALEEMRRRLLQLTDDLRRQRAESRAIVAGIAEGVFTVDRERRVQYLNPQAAALLGTSESAAIGRFCGDLLNPVGTDGRRPCEERCPIVHARFRGTARATEQLALADGSRRSVVITSAAIEEGFQSQVMRDETEVEAARRLRDAVLANISHEFRTPLSAQLASIELLLDQLPQLSQSAVRELVETQRRGALRLTQLIDNLLESVRVEAGRGELRRGPVDLAETVAAALDLTAPLAQQRGQRIENGLPPGLPPIEGDAPRLTQVLVNLIANAIKFGPPGSRIGLSGEERPDGVALFVEDDGPGLPPGERPPRFAPFVRSLGDGEPEQNGVGLGLYIAQSIVERHGGRVEIARAGDRTRVGFVLPRPAADSPGGGAGEAEGQ